MPEERTKQRVRYDRGSVEFGRVVGLTDGIYAIAMTLLVLTIGIPKVHPDGLVDELRAVDGDVLTFLIAITVLAYYWISNHRFVSHLAAMDPIYAGFNMIYLALVAFLPLPTALLDRYSAEPVTVVLFLTVLLLISLMEVVLFAWAHRRRLFTAEPSPRSVRYGMLNAVLPAIVFALAIPIGLLSSSTVALALWILINFPISIWIDHRLGPGSDYL